MTYDGSAKSLPRISTARRSAIYRSSDGEFEIGISSSPMQRDGSIERIVSLSRVLPDPTPGNSFDDYRFIRNTFKVSFGFDAKTRAGASVDLPLLRTSLLAWLDSGLQSRIISGEQ